MIQNILILLYVLVRFYQENGRGKRIPQFCEQLIGYQLIYKFEKHTNEWIRNFTCQIYISKSIF